MAERDRFELEIITPVETQNIFIEWIEVYGPHGSFVVGPNHSPLISIVKRGSQLVYKNSEGNEQSYSVKADGTLHVSSNKVTLLV